MKKILRTMFMLCLVNLSFAQTPMNLDSLLKLLPETKNDTNTVELYINIGQQYETVQPEIAKQYYISAGKLSQKLNYYEGYCKYAANYSAVLNMQGNYDSSLVVNLEALTVAEEWGDKMWITKMYFNIGNVYNYKTEYETALTYYLKVVPYFEETGNKAYLAMIYDVMQTLYQSIRDYPKAILYGEKAMALFEDKYSNARGNALINLSISYLYKTPSQPEKAMNGFREVLEIARRNQNKYLESVSLLNVADLYYRANDMEKAKPYYEQTIELCKETGDVESTCIAIRGLSYYQLYKNNYQLAEELIYEALKLATENNLLEEIQEAYSSLSELALAKHNYVEYRKYLKLKDSVATIIFNDEMLRVTQDIESKYETEKKQARIILLEKDRKIQFIFIAGLLFIILLLFITGFFYSRNLKRKRLLIEKDTEIKARRINELEKEKQLIAARSLLAGEETERTRLAGDLHDGLGGLLTGVKLKLSSMRENSIITSENLAHFNHALDLLDTSIAEMRRVAHNLMPETLMHYGLRTAISDFVRQVEPEDLPVIRFSIFGSDFRYSKELEITVYRIVQELVNNALKHARAKKIDVQLFTETNRVSVQIVDDGIGYDTEKAGKQTLGKGLRNITDRITAFNGHFETVSEPGKGTECTLEFLIT
ncbi:MAG: tetratricopeptide repeat protein [Bacteroidetes bacterium]|nr:MAG: tetratricopeptide repeat protein [Bacteroidota bacterium]